MKAIFSILLAAVLIQHAPASARSSNASPLIGSWAVDVSRLPMPPAARPKRVTITFGTAAGGRWSTRVDIVDAGGVESRAIGTLPLDGTPVSVTSLEADISAAKMPTPNVLVMQLGKNGIPGSTRIYTVAADGKTMVETAAYFDKGGKPILRTNYFTRIR